MDRGEGEPVKLVESAEGKAGRGQGAAVAMGRPMEIRLGGGEEESEGDSDDIPGGAEDEGQGMVSCACHVIDCMACGCYTLYSTFPRSCNSVHKADVKY